MKYKTYHAKKTIGSRIRGFVDKHPMAMKGAALGVGMYAAHVAAGAHAHPTAPAHHQPRADQAARGYNPGPRGAFPGPRSSAWYAHQYRHVLPRAAVNIGMQHGTPAQRAYAR